MGVFSKNLRFLRRSRNLSQDALAKTLGLNRGNIASYEKGTAEPNINNLTLISRFFGTDLNVLVETDLEQSRGHSDVDIMSEPEKETEKSRLAGHLQEKLIINKNELIRFKNRSNEMVKILEGFRQFHKFKMESSNEMSDDVKKMAIDYEKLLDILDNVLKTNKNLIDQMGG